MTATRMMRLGLLVGVCGLLVGLTGCGNTCGANNCQGCCDANNNCQVAATDHCGQNGASCATCSAFQTCLLGQCVFPGGNGNNGNGNGNGTGAGSTSSGTTNTSGTSGTNSTNGTNATTSNPTGSTTATTSNPTGSTNGTTGQQTNGSTGQSTNGTTATTSNPTGSTNGTTGSCCLSLGCEDQGEVCDPETCQCISGTTTIGTSNGTTIGTTNGTTIGTTTIGTTGSTGHPTTSTTNGTTNGTTIGTTNGTTGSTGSGAECVPCTPGNDATCNGGICVTDLNNNNVCTGGTCTTTCPNSSDSCFQITDQSGNTIGNFCFPTTEACGSSPTTTSTSTSTSGSSGTTGASGFCSAPTSITLNNGDIGNTCTGAFTDGGAGQGSCQTSEFCVDVFGIGTPQCVTICGSSNNGAACPAQSLCIPFSTQSGTTEELCMAACNLSTGGICPNNQACNPISPNTAHDVSFCAFPKCTSAAQCGGGTCKSQGYCACAADTDCGSASDANAHCDVSSGACYEGCNGAAGQCSTGGCCVQFSTIDYCDPQGH